MSKLSATDRKFLRALAELVAQDFVKKHDGKSVREVEDALADEIERTTLICLEAKL